MYICFSELVGIISITSATSITFLSFVKHFLLSADPVQ